jgi:hypothetical protein
LRLVDAINELPSEVCFNNILRCFCISSLLVQIAGVGLDADAMDNELTSVRLRNQVHTQFLLRNCCTHSYKYQARLKALEALDHADGSMQYLSRFAND